MELERNLIITPAEKVGPEQDFIPIATPDPPQTSPEHESAKKQRYIYKKKNGFDAATK